MPRESRWPHLVPSDGKLGCGSLSAVHLHARCSSQVPVPTHMGPRLGSRRVSRGFFPGPWIILLLLKSMVASDARVLLGARPVLGTEDRRVDGTCRGERGRVNTYHDVRGRVWRECKFVQLSRKVIWQYVSGNTQCLYLLSQSFHCWEFNLRDSLEARENKVLLAVLTRT